jgi:hypothetical protein
MIVAVFLYGTVWYSHRARTHAVNSGKASVREQTNDTIKPETPVTALGSQPAQTLEPRVANATDTQAGAQPQGSAVKPPAADSIRRNPPNGMIFAGTGKYQLYRQGDITWRVNTQSGDACIFFATGAQWRNPQVYSHGCGPA